MDYNSFLKRDFKSLCNDTDGGTRRWRFRCTRLHIVIILACVALLATLFTFASHDAEAKRNPTSEKQTTGPAQAASQARQRLNLPLAVPGTVTGQTDAPQPRARQTQPAASIATGEEAPGQWQSVTVRRGDTLAAIFSRLDLKAGDLHAIMALGKPTATLKHLLPGQRVRVRTTGHDELQELVYHVDKLDSLRVLRDGGEFQANPITRTPEVRFGYAAGTINSSLFLAAQKAGLSENLTMELAQIFGWDIDFALDIRAGDHFSVIYEEDYLDGKKLRDGDIVAAEFTNNGKTYRAVRYTDAKGHTGYYTPDGRSMRKAFLRTPVAYTYISSRFGMRYHPILHRMRMHDGVDYAAPRGTPIKAAGDGRIIFRGRQNGYGNVVIIKHGGPYSTLYGHMWKFARGQHVGSRVRQGEVIGYVGMSGLATGPHLHYEFRINGVHRNPLTVKLPQAAPIAAVYKANFEAHAQHLLAQLSVYARTELASNQP